MNNPASIAIKRSAVFAIGSGALALCLHTESATADPHCEAAPPLPKRFAGRIFELAKREPRFRRGLEAVGNPELKRFLQGPSSESIHVKAHGQPWVGSFSCIAHMCDTHQLLTLYDPKTGRTAAQIRVEQNRRYIGPTGPVIDAAFACAIQGFKVDK